MTTQRTTSHHSLLIANLSVLWILIFYVIYLSTHSVKLLYHTDNNSLIETILFLTLPNTPFIVGAFAISYAVYKYMSNKLSNNVTFKAILIVSTILFGLVLSYVLILCLYTLAYGIAN